MVLQDGERLAALEYYNELTEVEQDRFDDMIRYLCETKPGMLLPKTYYRIEDAAHKIYALKPRDHRFFNFMTSGAKIIVTNAYHKHSQQMTKADLEHLKIATSCLSWKCSFLMLSKRNIGPILISPKLWGLRKVGFPVI